MTRIHLAVLAPRLALASWGGVQAHLSTCLHLWSCNFNATPIIDDMSTDLKKLIEQRSPHPLTSPLVQPLREVS